MADNDNFHASAHDLPEETQPAADSAGNATEAPPPERLRVHSLARVLGTTSRKIIDALVELDGRARSAHSTVGREEADRVRFDRLLNVVMSEPAVVEMQLTAPNRVGSYRATMLLMPLRSDFGDINRVLGCLSGESDNFTAPLSFSIRDTTTTPIEQHQPVPEPRAAMPGFAEETAAFAGAPEAPKLRAIDGGNQAAPSKPRPGVRRFRVIDGK